MNQAVEKRGCAQSGRTHTADFRHFRGNILHSNNTALPPDNPPFFRSLSFRIRQN